MKTSRSLYHLRLWVLVCFALALVGASLAPIVHAKSTEVICSANGSFQTVVLDDDGDVNLGGAGPDCHLCILCDAPPAQDLKLQTQRPHTSHLASTSHAPVLIVAATSVPPPARAPPVFFPSQS